MLNCGISFEEYQKVSRCKTAKKIWDKLHITHEDTTQVKQTRIDMLNKEYKMFTMKEGESIYEMFERFSIIINSLDTIEITHSKQVLVKKVIKSLTKEWETKATIIFESSNLNQMTYEELRGKLLAYEITHMKNDIRKKGVALKSCVKSLDDESNDSLSDEEIVFFARKFRRLMRLKGRSRRGSSKEPKKDISKVIYHNCKKVGHFKYDCPKLKREDKSQNDKKKVIMASWEDLENDTKEDK
ncbi:uncharacterized protein [Arachis hypogaea]|uniref:uncharacterized protein n=1 Tax=Arachis hypogaea TaxID=3818 RepID=UPI003B223B82